MTEIARLARGINPETGEIGHFVPYDAGYEIVSAEQREQRRKWYAREKAAARRLEMRWVACYHDAIQAITKDLTLTEAGALIRLLPFLRFKSDGALVKDGKPLKQADIQRIFKRSKANTTAILKRLESLGVIKREAVGRSNEYYISVEFHTFGSVREGARFTKLYQFHANEITSDLDLNEIGLLYKILPYFHYKTFYLCANPDEPDEFAIQHLTREELAAAIGHDPDTVTTIVNRLQSKGVIMSTKAWRTTHYIVHPDVMYRQEGEDIEYTAAIRKMFERHRKSSCGQIDTN